MLTVAIGPVTKRPSWQWIGQDTARELKRYFRVEVFRRTPPRCDVALIVKVPLDPNRAARALERGTRLVYMPIDRYESPAEIRADAAMLGACSAVLIHCERLRPYLEGLTPAVWPIDHHNRFGLAIPPPYRRDGFILWVGGFQYAPYILRWVELAPLPRPLVLLADHGNRWARLASSRLAATLGLTVQRRGAMINGHALVKWSARRQAELLATAQAAIDIKAGTGDWNQHTKPPTKAQTFVASGVPCAMNAESYSTEYFAARGFDLATPGDSERWLSEEYWRETGAEARRLQHDISLASVGARLADYVRRVADG